MNTRTTFYDYGLDFSRDGCFVRPLTPEELLSMSAPSDMPYLASFQEAYYNFCHGDFSDVPTLLKIIKDRDRENSCVTFAATELMGYVGTVDVFRSMRNDVERWLAQPRDTPEWPYERFCSYIRAFENWGRLDIVPFLLEVYRHLHGGMFDLGCIPLAIANLLASATQPEMCREPTTNNLDKYLDTAMTRYHQVVANEDSDMVVVMQGNLRTMHSVANQILTLGQGKPSRSLGDALHRLRRVFEPATGIDCTAMFNRDGHVSQTDVTFIAATFLKRPTFPSYREGFRTFFGHRVPSFKAKSW